MVGPDLERKARRAAARAARRLRYRAGLRRLALWLPLPLGYATVALITLKLGAWGSTAERAFLASAVFVLLLALGVTLRALIRRPPRWSGALALDEHHQLGDRLTTALALLERPEASRTGLSQLAIEDGLAQATRLDPRRAVPIPIPRELLVSAALALMLVAAAWLEVRVVRVLPPPPTFVPLVMTGDDLDLFGDIARRLAERAEDPDSLASIRRFNALIEDIAGRRLERHEAFQRMSELEAELAKSADIDREARELGLEGLAQELGKSGLAKTAAQALEEKRLADAEKALRELAERLKKKDRPPSRAELDRLRNAAARASRVNSERLQAIEERRRELLEQKQSLLKKKGQPQTPAEAAKADAEREENRRKLERLERDQDRATRAARELSDLDRELAKAAEDLQRDTQSAAEDIRRSAEELSKVRKRELSEKEKRELLDRLRELKELLRQQGQGGQERLRQMARFGQRARGGKKGEGGQEQKAGGKKPGPGGMGGSEMVEIPRLVRERQAGSASKAANGAPEAKGGDGKGSTPGAGSQAGPDWGTGHDENLAGEATKPPAGETRDVTAAAVDTGQGTASAETIRGAAERGFVGKAYRDIFVDYQSVAEQSLEHDQIPPGYRFYVRRYFQLIRPRE